MPLMTVFLREQAGFTFLQIGIAASIMGLPMLFSPVLITFFADRNIDPRRILAVAFTSSACVLTAMFFSTQIKLTLLLYFVHGLSFVAMLPLQDGFFFSLTQQMKSEGKYFPEYPFVRVWGTIGFIVPSLLLYFPLKNGAEPGSILPVAVFFCVLSMINSFFLPPLERKIFAAGTGRRIPTRQAFARLYSPEGRWLAIGIFFGLLAASIYYSFIANYFDEVIHIPRQYIGLIINIGVVLEIGYSLLMPAMQRKIGLKAIISLGLGLMSLRMFLLATFPTPLVAVLVQVMHGMEVLALYIAPPMFINRLAGDEFRNSMQGVYTMGVGGLSRVIAGTTAGFVIMNGDLKNGLYLGAGLALTAFIIITLFFERIPPLQKKQDV